MPLSSNDRELIKLDVDKASLSLLVALRKASLRAFKPLGFTYLEALVLVIIEAGNTQPTELGRLLGVVLPGLSSMTAKMSEAGFLTKEVVEGDHRQVYLQLTSQGKRACREIRSAWAAHNPIDTTVFSDEEISAFLRISQSLLQ